MNYNVSEEEKRRHDGVALLYRLVFPVFMSYRKAIQGVAVHAPARQEAVHQSEEAGVVRGLQEMDHFMHHDVFETLARFPGEIGIEPDVGGAMAAASPLGFHALDEVALHLHAN